MQDLALEVTEVHRVEFDHPDGANAGSREVKGDRGTEAVDHHDGGQVAGARAVVEVHAHAVDVDPAARHAADAHAEARETLRGGKESGHHDPAYADLAVMPWSRPRVTRISSSKSSTIDQGSGTTAVSTPIVTRSSPA